jgi:hypothetical protein
MSPITLEMSAGFGLSLARIAAAYVTSRKLVDGAMWLTGFDAPSCSTVYLDKPVRNHTLMQTIARANRVFPGKHSGVIVDYANVFAIRLFPEHERDVVDLDIKNGDWDNLLLPIWPTRRTVTWPPNRSFTNSRPHSIASLSARVRIGKSV